MKFSSLKLAIQLKIEFLSKIKLTETALISYSNSYSAILSFGIKYLVFEKEHTFYNQDQN